MRVQPRGRRNGIVGGSDAEMNECRVTEEILSVWTESGRVEAAALAALEEHVAACSVCAARVGGVLPLVRRDAGQRDAATLPHDAAPSSLLVANVLNRLGAAPRIARSRPGLWAFALAAAAVVAVGIGTLALRASPDRGGPAGGATMVVRFELAAPEARLVHLVGDFTGWQERKVALADGDHDGVWEVTVRLSRGRAYSYNFLVDGESWVVDPEAEVTVDDGFGGLSSVILL